MKEYKTIKKEIEEEVVDKMLCDNCKKEIEHHGCCGFGEQYILSDAWCNQCGGTTWEFCSLKCLKEFVNKSKENKK